MNPSYKKFIYCIVSWLILILIMATVKFKIDEISLRYKIETLQAEYEVKSQGYDVLKAQYTAAANDYLADRKIGRVVRSVNPWLDDEHVQLWIKMLKESGDGILAGLNNFSLKKLGTGDSLYSLRPGIALLISVGAFESDFRLFSDSGKGAYGPMQLKKITAVQVGIKDRQDPEENIRGGALHLVSLLQKYYQYPDQLELALATYNAGASRVKGRWIPEWGAEWHAIYSGLSADMTFKETRTYVTAVMELTRLFASGRWNSLDQNFWSNYRQFIFRADYVTVFDEEKMQITEQDDS